MYQQTTEEDLIATLRSSPRTLIDRDTATIVLPGNIKIWFTGDFGKADQFNRNIPEAIEFDQIIDGEVSEIMHEIDQNGILIIRGDLGAGKSESICKLAQLLQGKGRNTIRIDGHNNSIPVELIDQIITWAKDNDAVILYDSADYLMAGSTKYKRELPIDAHRQRSNGIWDRLIAANKEQGVKTIMTMHDEAWINFRGDPELVATFKEKFQTVALHKVKAIFNNVDGLRQYYLKHDRFDDLPAELLNRLPLIATAIYDPEVRAAFIQKLGVEANLESIKNQILGLFSRDQLTLYGPFLNSLPEFIMIQDQDLEGFINMFLNEIKSFRFHKLLVEEMVNDSDDWEAFLNSPSLNNVMEFIIQMFLKQFSERIIKSVGLKKTN